MKTIIALNGKIGAGKTTLMNILSEILSFKGYQVKTVNFADKLKKICFELTGHYGYTQEDKNIYLEDWGMTVGECLQIIGTNALRNNFHQDVWVISTLNNIESNSIYLIGDCRFPNEADAVKKKGGIVVRLNGDPADVNKNSTRDVNHISETALDSYQHFDYVYENNKDIVELWSFAQQLVKDINE